MHGLPKISLVRPVAAFFRRSVKMRFRYDANRVRHATSECTLDLYAYCVNVNPSPIVLDGGDRVESGKARKSTIVGLHGAYFPD
jgi:hypothetical protein